MSVSTGHRPLLPAATPLDWGVGLAALALPLLGVVWLQVATDLEPVGLVAAAFLVVASLSMLLVPRGVLSARTWVVAYLMLEFPVRALFLLSEPTERPPLYAALSPGVGLESALTRALLESLLGLVVMLATYWLAVPRPGRRPAVVRAVQVRSGRALLLIGVGAALLPVEVAGASDVTGGGGFALSLPGLAAAGGAAVVAYAFVQAPRSCPWVFLATLAYTLSRVLLLSSKLALLSCLVAVVVSVVVRMKGRAGRRAAGLRTGVVLVLGAVAASYVFALSLGRTDGTAAGERPLRESVTTGAAAAVSRSYGVDAVVASDAHLDAGADLLHGATLTEVAYSWVPRALWPDKPKSFSVRFGESVFSFSSLAGDAFFSPSYTGEWLLNFGLAGVVVGWLVFGLLLARIDAIPLLAHRVVWIIVAVHLVEGSIVAQLWMAAPFLAGGYLVVRRD